MEKGLFEVLTEICNEKGISQEVLIDALEAEKLLFSTKR